MRGDLLETVRRLGVGLVDTAQSRLRLLQAELGEELDRLGVMLTRQILLALSALLTLQLLVLVVLALTWDTAWRLPSLLALLVLAAAGTFIAYRSYQASRQRTKQMFAASIGELEKDRLALEKAV